MGKLEAIEQNIQTLSSDELTRFREWFADFDATNWEREIAAQLRGGKLDQIAQRALKDHAAGKSTLL